MQKTIKLQRLQRYILVQFIAILSILLGTSTFIKILSSTTVIRGRSEERVESVSKVGELQFLHVLLNAL